MHPYPDEGLKDPELKDAVEFYLQSSEQRDIDTAVSVVAREYGWTGPRVTDDERVEALRNIALLYNQVNDAVKAGELTPTPDEDLSGIEVDDDEGEDEQEWSDYLEVYRQEREKHPEYYRDGLDNHGRPVELWEPDLETKL